MYVHARTLKALSQEQAAGTLTKVLFATHARAWLGSCSCRDICHSGADDVSVLSEATRSLMMGGKVSDRRRVR
jgi:hypothetical protein